VTERCQAQHCSILEIENLIFDSRGPESVWEKETHTQGCGQPAGSTRKEMMFSSGSESQRIETTTKAQEIQK
jgi:hypothetical protein